MDSVITEGNFQTSPVFAKKVFYFTFLETVLFILPIYFITHSTF